MFIPHINVFLSLSPPSSLKKKNIYIYIYKFYVLILEREKGKEETETLIYCSTYLHIH